MVMRQLIKTPSANIPKGLLGKVSNGNEHAGFQQSKRDYEKKAAEM